MKRKLLAAMLLQALGPAMLLGLSLYISRQLGAAEQGIFASAKARLDFMVALGSFGFPQSVILAINRDGCDTKRLFKDAIFYSAGITGILFLSAIFMPQSGNESQWVAMCFAVGAGGIVLNNLWRGVLLTIDDGIRFHLFTCLPAVMLAMVYFSIGGLAIEKILAIAGVLTVLGSVFLYPYHKQNISGTASPNYLKLVSNGADSFAQAMAAAIQTFTFLAVAQHGGGQAAAGYFSFAVMAFQMSSMPLQMVSPMLLNRWSQSGQQDALNAGASVQFRIFLVAFALIAMAIVLAPMGVRLALGASFEGAVLAIQILLVSTMPALLSRLNGLRLTAAGLIRANSMVALLRTFVAVGLLLLLAHGQSEVISVHHLAVCWLLGECAAAFLSHSLLVSFAVRPSQ